MVSSVLDPPAAAVTPRSAAESALVAAYETMGAAAVDAAERLADAAAASLERQVSELASSGRVAELKILLEKQHGLAAVYGYLVALGNGEQPGVLPKPDVSADLVACFIRVEPNRFARLLAKASSMADTAEVNSGKAEARMAVCCSEYSAGVLDLPTFVSDYARLLTEQAQQQQRAERYRAAISAARGALQRGAEALGLHDLRSGLREAAALSSREPDPVVSEMSAALESIDGELTRLGLGLDGDQADEPGPITAALKSQRDDLAERIKSRKRELAAQTRDNSAELVERARGGDPSALCQVAGTVRARRLIFRPGLSEDLVDALAESLAASSPDVWAELVLSERW